MKLLVAGAAGFIGNYFVEYALSKGDEVTVLDKLTYAGRPENLKRFELNNNFNFRLGSIADWVLVPQIVKNFDAVVNFAAESHVDRSINQSASFVDTNIVGVSNLLDACLKNGIKRFHQVSTDEVFPIKNEWEPRWVGDAMTPRNIYAASKASAEHLVNSYHHTHGLETIITRGTNTIGQRQHPEKLVPKFIISALLDKPLTIYGKGNAVRSYFHVEDHAQGIYHWLVNGEPGETYHLGPVSGDEHYYGKSDKNTVEMANLILDKLNKPKSLIEYVEDRKGHDQRYAIYIGEHDWLPKYSFEEALTMTVDWYINNEKWWKPILEEMETKN
jgi:dTDP-glucose 4,6-dehydratase